MRSEVVVPVLLGLLTGCTQATQSAAPPATALINEGSSGRALLDASDFRKRFVDVAKAVRPAVVTITSIQEVEAPRSPFGGGGLPFEFFFRNPGGGGPEGEVPGKRERSGMGSGVIIGDDGTIVTNNHVVENAKELKVVLQDERELRAKLVGTDPKSDLAVIRIAPEDLRGLALKAVPLGRSSQVEVGEWVLAVGAPFGLRQTVSAGIVSAVGRGHMGIADYEDFLQTDAAINPGNSGGPLVNLEGEVIGINTAIASRNGGSQGVGFAIPIDMVRKVAEQLIATGTVVRGYLGVFIGDLTPDLAASFDFAGRDGVLVQDVEQAGPGAAAGLKPGDIIFERDGTPTTDVTVFRNAIAASAPSSTVKLKVWREGKALSLELRLGKLGDEQTSRVGVTPTTGQNHWGVDLSDLTPELRQRLKVPGSEGVIVRHVEPGSSADRAGLREGDVVVGVGGQSIGSAGAAKQSMLAAPRDKPLRLRILRDGHGLFVLLPVTQK